MDAPELIAVKAALAKGAEPSMFVLVEGVSDQAALETLAARRGRDLDGEGVSIIPMGGATTIGHFLDLLGPHGHDFRLAGLCDSGEEDDFDASWSGPAWASIRPAPKWSPSGFSSASMIWKMSSSVPLGPMRSWRSSTPKASWVPPHPPTTAVPP